MLKKMLKCAIAPVTAVVMVLALTSATEPGGGDAPKKVINSFYCQGDHTGCLTGTGNECTTGSGNCVPNPCPEGTSATNTRPRC